MISYILICLFEWLINVQHSSLSLENDLICPGLISITFHHSHFFYQRLCTSLLWLAELILPQLVHDRIFCFS
jgi:hypothetical protein